MFGRFGGIVFFTLLFLSSFLGPIFLIAPALPLTYFAPRAWRRVADRLVGYWLTFPASMLFFLFNVKVRVTGDCIDRTKPALIIMNHRTRLDWLFFWNALYKMDPWLLTTEKISLKSGLKNLPGAGWAMSCNAFCFLNRKYGLDQRVLEVMLKYYKDSKLNYQLLLYPEGTDRGERAITISHEYAEKNGLARYEYCLHPRTTGFNYVLNQLRKNEYIGHVYDVTVGYSKNIVESELQLLKDGKFPEEVHFDVCKYDVADIVGENVDKNRSIDASEWLLSLWKRKEERLRQFYETDRRFVPSGVGYIWPIDKYVAAYYLAFTVWCVLIALWLYLIYVSYWIKLYALVCIMFYSWGQHAKGGLEFLFIELFYGKRFFLAPNESP